MRSSEYKNKDAVCEVVHLVTKCIRKLHTFQPNCHSSKEN